jgi:signal transduction histidine kinase
MTDRRSTDRSVTASPVPRLLIMTVAGILCLAILGSSIYSFTALSRLRIQYLAHRGQEIASSLEAQVRGPGKRNNPSFWQSIFEDNYDVYSGSAAYLALADHHGTFLAAAGDRRPSSMEEAVNDDSGLFVFREKLDRPRKSHAEESPGEQGWELVIGLDPESSDLIRRPALFQAVVSGIAVVMIIALSVYLTRMLTRYVRLKALESSEAHLKSLGSMAASLAHEIRNPLGAMKGLTQLAQEELPPDNGVQSRLSTVVEEAERLERLVNDLLDFARPREPQISDFDLVALLVDVASMLQSRIASSGVTLDIRPDAASVNVRSDQSGIRQVVLNVLLNALDASPEGSAIRITVVQDSNSGYAIVQVDDSGTGLGGRDPADLMQPFVTTRYRGTGLGLAVSGRIMERLGGSLTLQDNPGGGARCSITVPAV